MHRRRGLVAFGRRIEPALRPWQEGECLVFDDTSEHEAWNRSSQPRTVLLLDFLRPGVDTFDDEAPAAVEDAIQRRLRDGPSS